MWRSIILTVLQAEYRVGRACELPEYLGSTLRGVLGHELRAVSCVELDGPCTVCIRPDRCASGALFEDAPSVAHPGSEGMEAARGNAGGFDRPRPYILDVPPRRRGTYRAGETVRLGVTLVGRARTWSPWVIAAMAGISRRGLSVERHPLSLARLTVAGPASTVVEIVPASFEMDASDGSREKADRPLEPAETARLLLQSDIPELRGAGIVAEAPAASSQAIVSLMTPADLQQKGRRLDRLDGPTFFRRLIRRIGTLVETYCTPPPDGGACDYRALAALADQVVVEDQNVYIKEWERYSNRGGAKHPLSGLVGEALFTRIAEPLWPYLILGQRVHLGKGASFGQGRYVVMSQPDPLPGATP